MSIQERRIDIILYDLILDSGVPTFFAGQHQGVVEEPCVMIVNMGETESFLTYGVGRGLIHIMLHVPKDNYTDIFALQEDIIKLIKCNNSDLIRTGNIFPILVDDDKESYFTSIEYKINKKLL